MAGQPNDARAIDREQMEPTDRVTALLQQITEQLAELIEVNREVADGMAAVLSLLPGLDDT